MSAGQQRLMRAVIAILVVAWAPARAQVPSPVVADLSQRRIEIRYSFAGADLILFGAIQREDVGDRAADIIIELIGPPRTITVRRKARRFGIWVNQDAVDFAGAPGYYALASTRPVDAILSDDQRLAAAIGLDRYAAGAASPAFAAALIRHQAAAGLYRLDQAPIALRDQTLFRTDLRLPANVPVGPYQARVFLVADGTILDRQEIRLDVDKSGFERTVYDFANDQPLAYGLVAVLIALGAGWTAGAFSRR